MTNEQRADEMADKALDDLDALDLLSDPEFADWALQVACEEHEAREYSLMCAELAHGLG